jgi:hypothetical protein
MNIKPLPPLPLDEWQETQQTLHMWTQVVGKIRLALTPRTNQWWNVALYVTSRGLTTRPMPYGQRFFQIDFDFIDHRMDIASSDGRVETLELKPRSVADFYKDVMLALARLDIAVKIWTMPVEVPDPMAFEKDEQHASYDAEYVDRFWHALAEIDCVFKEFRARFTGKCSPVHFFWGSFDLAVTRFSGKSAEPKPDADRITRLSYNAELSSLGFWTGGGGVNGPAFYSYTFPEPAGFREQKVEPQAAYYNNDLGEFLLMYDDVRSSDDPAAAILDFGQTTYEAGARLQGWAIEQFELETDRQTATSDEDDSKPISEFAISKAPNKDG